MSTVCVYQVSNIAVSVYINPYEDAFEWLNDIHLASSIKCIKCLVVTDVDTLSDRLRVDRMCNSAEATGMFGTQMQQVYLRT